MNKLFNLTKSVLGIGFVFALLVSCSKDNLPEPVVPSGNTPVVIDPIVKPITYTVVATGENVIFSPESTTVEKDGTAKFEAKAINTLVEADYFEFKGVNTQMGAEDSVVSLEKINEDSKVFVKFKDKEITTSLSKIWEIYSFKIGNLLPQLANENLKSLDKFNLGFNRNGTQLIDPSGRSKWKLISREKKDDTIGLWFDNNPVVERTIIELTTTKLVLRELSVDLATGKPIYTYSTYFAK